MIFTYIFNHFIPFRGFLFCLFFCFFDCSSAVAQSDVPPDSNEGDAMVATARLFELTQHPVLLDLFLALGEQKKRRKHINRPTPPDTDLVALETRWRQRLEKSPNDTAQIRRSLIVPIEKWLLSNEHKAPRARDIQSKLAPNQALIAWYYFDTLLFGVKISNAGDTIWVKKGHHELPYWTREFFHNAFAPFKTPPQNPREDLNLYKRSGALWNRAAYELYMRLFYPFGDLPESLVLVPDGILFALAFDALLTAPPKMPWDFKTHAFLIYRHEMSTFPTLTHFANTSPMPAGEGVFFDNPAPTQNPPPASLRDARLDTSPLPFTRDVREEVSNIVCEKILNEENKIPRQSTSFSLIHLFSPAKIFDQIPEESFIATPLPTLSGAVRVEKLRKMPARLFVLTACEAAPDTLLDGQGIQSWERNFLDAGNATLAYSLWATHDRHTRQIIAGFYQNLRAGQPKPRALRTARLDFLAQTENYYCAPFFWAGLKLTGAAEPVSLKCRTGAFSNGFALILGGLLLAGGLIFGIWRKRRQPE